MCGLIGSAPVWPNLIIFDQIPMLTGRMETAQIRLELLDRIALTEDINLLRQLLQFMDVREEEEYSMSPAEKSEYQAELQAGIDDGNAGNVVDFQEVKERWKKRLANG